MILLVLGSNMEKGPLSAQLSESSALLVCRALADMNKDGRMDQVEFSIAMKLIKLKLQGYQLPPALPPVMKQQPAAISSAPAFGKSEITWFLCCVVVLKMAISPSLSSEIVTFSAGVA